MGKALLCEQEPWPGSTAGPVTSVKTIFIPPDSRERGQRRGPTVEERLRGVGGALGLKRKGAKERSLAQQRDTAASAKPCAENTHLIAYVSTPSAQVTHKESKPTGFRAEILHLVTLASGRHFPKPGCDKRAGFSEHRRKQEKVEGIWRHVETCPNE